MLEEQVVLMLQTNAKALKAKKPKLVEWPLSFTELSNQIKGDEMFTQIFGALMKFLLNFMFRFDLFIGVTDIKRSFHSNYFIQI